MSPAGTLVDGGADATSHRQRLLVLRVQLTYRTPNVKEWRRGHAGSTLPKEAKMAFSRTSIKVAAFTSLLVVSTVGYAKDYIKGERPQQRGYSEAVITEGGRTVWLAGQTATVDDTGRSLASDLEGQVRQLFKNLDRTLQKAGGKLSDMVQMTVFITDVRYGDRLTQIRREVFGDNFPGSALITITALAVPDAKIEGSSRKKVGGRRGNMSK
jgi:2-iminobutanoate/2-iminopropanoate deaminase